MATHGVEKFVFTLMLIKVTQQMSIKYFIQNILLFVVLISIYDYGVNFFSMYLFVFTMPDWYSSLFNNTMIENAIWLQFWHILSVLIPAVIVASILKYFKTPIIKALIIVISMRIIYLQFEWGVVEEHSYFILMRVFDELLALVTLPLITYFVSKKYNKQINKYKFNF